MEKGDLIKITTSNCIYWGIFEKKDKNHFMAYAIEDNPKNFIGLSQRPDIPIMPYIFMVGTKMRVWKPKTFDKKISRFGLCVREGVFCDRLTMTEETANKLIEIINDLTNNLKWNKQQN